MLQQLRQEDGDGLDQDGSCGGGGGKQSNSMNSLKGEQTELLADWLRSVRDRAVVRRALKNRIAMDTDGEALEKIKELSADVLYWLGLLLVSADM